MTAKPSGLAGALSRELGSSGEDEPSSRKRDDDDDGDKDEVDKRARKDAGTRAMRAMRNDDVDAFVRALRDLKPFL